MMRLLMGFGQVRADSRRFKVAEWVQNGNFAPGGPSTPSMVHQMAKTAVSGTARVLKRP